MELTPKRAQELAGTLRAFADEYLAEGLEMWEDEPDMIEMYQGDASDYRYVATLLAGMRIEQALRAARHMDTAPRDRIPDEVWDAMVLHCEGEV